MAQQGDKGNETEMKARPRQGRGDRKPRKKKTGARAERKPQ